MYARLDDFDGIIRNLMQNRAVEPLPMTLGEETACLSLLLRVYTLPDLNEEAQSLVLELCDKFSHDMIRRYPFCEGYVDFLYGAAAIRRGMN